MRKDGNDHRIHLEFADFSDEKFFKLFEKYIVRNANSLGMNEQEMNMLLSYWNNPETFNLREAVQSQPSFEEILDQIREFFKK